MSIARNVANFLYEIEQSQATLQQLNERKEAARKRNRAAMQSVITLNQAVLNQQKSERELVKQLEELIAEVGDYPSTEQAFEEWGGFCPYCGNTTFSEHWSDCPMSEADFEEDDAVCTCTMYSMGVEVSSLDQADFSSSEGCEVHGGGS